MKKLTRCIWLVDLLMRIDNLTRSEIADRWERYQNSKNTYPERNFYRDKKDIPELCGAVIEENGYGGYFISNKKDVLSNKAYQLFASAIKKQELLKKYKNIHESLILSSLSTGDDKLETLANAIDEKITVSFTYQSFWWEDNEVREYHAYPHFLKEHKGRWYLIYTKLDSKKLRVAALERMDNIILGDKPNIRIEKVTPKVLDDCFGVFFGDQEPQKVVIKVYGNQVKYIRSLPLHTSQYEAETTPEYSIFRYHIRPTYDFEQELLWHRDTVEVLEPKGLRDSIAALVSSMNALYR